MGVPYQINWAVAECPPSDFLGNTLLRIYFYQRAGRNQIPHRVIARADKRIAIALRVELKQVMRKGGPFFGTGWQQVGFWVNWARREVQSKRKCASLSQAGRNQGRLGRVYGGPELCGFGGIHSGPSPFRGAWISHYSSHGGG